MRKDAKIFVAGDDTLIGAAISHLLAQRGYSNILNQTPDQPSLVKRTEVEQFFALFQPEYVFVAGGKSGGIGANQNRPADLMLDNLLQSCHVLDAASRHGAGKLLYLASSCSYPKHCPQPMQVESLLSAPLEATNEAYALAKIAGMKLAQSFRVQYDANFITAIPANAFGPGDDFSPEDSHVIAGLIRKMHEAKKLTLPAVDIWGSGMPKRDFIFVADLAQACLFLMDNYDDAKPINVGTGVECSIRDLAVAIRQVVGYEGELVFDSSKPDGMPRKLLDTTALQALGWMSETDLSEGLQKTYDWFLETQCEETALEEVYEY